MQHEILSYATPERNDQETRMSPAVPAISLVSAVIPFAGLALRNIVILLLGAPITGIGVIAAIISLIFGRGATRAMGIAGILLNIPAILWYYQFFVVGIC